MKIRLGLQREHRARRALRQSALEALSLDEAVWFDAFFDAYIVPIFSVEALADLEKQMADGRTPEDVVGSWPRRHRTTPLRTCITAASDPV